MSIGYTILSRRIVGFMLFVASLVACTSAPERIAVPTPTPVPTEQPTATAVAAPSPTVVPTAEPTLADDDPTSVTTIEAGTEVVDEQGNLLAVHRAASMPAELVGIERLDLFDQTEALLGAGPIVLLDVSWCSAGSDVEPLDAPPDLSLVQDVADPLSSSVWIPLHHALVDPGFLLPAAGTCTRGWLPTELLGTGQIARYVLAFDGPSGPETHVYQWQLAPLVSTDALDRSDVPGTFRRGQVVTFNQGALQGTTIDFGGWSELRDLASPVPETRVVGVLVEVCTATEDWPEFGLSVQGWNVLEPYDPSDRLGADPLSPLTDRCFEDWIEFAVPFGVVATGFFVSDGVDAETGFASWTLEGAAIDP